MGEDGTALEMKCMACAVQVSIAKVVQFQSETNEFCSFVQDFYVELAIMVSLNGLKRVAEFFSNIQV